MTRVVAIDGDQWDDVCAARNGKVYGIFKVSNTERARSLLGGSTDVASALRKALLEDASDYRWVAAAIVAALAATAVRAQDFQLDTKALDPSLAGEYSWRAVTTLVEGRQLLR